MGKRMDISITRALLKAALEGELEMVEFVADPTFKVLVPKYCTGVPSEVLWPRNTWSDKAAYDAKAKHLAQLFVKNFTAFADGADADILSAAPNAQ